jgi:hypothetical protein
LRENFDRFNFAIYKEKEMADFRKWITAFAVLAMFAGLASAQINGGGGGGGTPLSCQATVTAPPQLRGEGMTEFIGDIVLTCTGGLASPTGLALPTVNFTVSLATNVTSRLMSGNLSEAILMIDEPGSGLSPVVPGSGPAAPQTLCAFGGGAVPGACGSQYPINVTLPGGASIQVMSSSSATITAPYNMYLGTVAGNQVVFNGIPVLAPATTNALRVYRITNVRANVAGLTAGLAGTTPLNASISISGNQSIPVSNSFVTAGYIQNGLSTGLRNAANTGGGNPNLNQCNSQGTGSAGPLGVGILQYTENFATAFKTRVATVVNGVPTTYNGQSSNPTAQNVPGQVQASESGFYNPLQTTTSIGGITSASTSPVGVADYGTRLKSVFNNIPAGVRIFVSVTNLVTNTSNASTAQPTPPSNTSSFAVLVAGEAVPDGNGSVPLVAPSTSVNGSPGTTGLAELTVTGGSATAVWEVMNTNPAANETFNFGVYTVYTANPGANSPPPGTATVNQSFAPTPAIAFSAAAGAAASATLTLPRFADTSTARNLLTIVICQTYLLFPFLTNASGSGFDTGIAIANTSTDPSTIGTAPQNGTCDMFFYGDKAPATLPVTTANIPTATVYTTLTSTAAPGFTGYMIARCNFQWAHGFAFISDIGARNLAMGYLALVINNGTIARGTAAESLGN